jgi:glycosyltransferase involved in cell wall biosynthesis
LQTDHPKITIITPVYNQVDYLEATIQSVINQNYPNLEYIVIDGGSTDGTLGIIKSYETHITKWVSEPDNGMYDALNKGFSLSTGDVMGWINSDDVLLPQSLFNVARLFKELPQVSWIRGLNCVIDLKGQMVNVLIPKRFSLIRILNGDYRWIQQESAFWRRSLWDKSGGHLHNDLKLAGDFELWFRFFQYEKLFYVNIPFGAWRKRPGQLSETHIDQYTEEVYSTIVSYTQSKEQQLTLKKIRWLSFLIRNLSKLQLFNLNYLVRKRDSLLKAHNVEIRYKPSEEKFLV